MYRDVTGNRCLTCYCTVILDVLPKIRHGTSLVFRNITWRAIREQVKTPTISRGVLKSLGCDNWAMLLTARDRLGDNIDIIERVVEDGNVEEIDSTIAAFYGDAMFYQGGVIDNDGLGKKDVYVDIGYDLPEMVEKKLQNRISEARENGLSNEGAKTLATVTDKNKDVFKTRLRSRGPAKATPMKINLEESIRPVKVKVRRYPPDQRAFLDVYFDELVSLGFLKTRFQAEWQAAPHFISKESKSR